ncbi:MAG: FG-GAP repeat domain-containing protein, partial [Phycisphaerae bacterium]
MGFALTASVLNAGPIEFTDVTAGSGIVYDYDRDGSVTVGDYNGDGWLDVLVTGSDVTGVQLFRNNGNKTFTNVTAAVLPANISRAHMGLFADMDDDGDEDLLLGAYYARNDSALELLVNTGGVFSYSPQDLSFTHDYSRVGGIPVGDMDGDRDLDLFFTHKPGPNFYLRNDGINQLVDQTAWFGADLNLYDDICSDGVTFTCPDRTMSTVLVEMNGDRIPDLYAAVDVGGNYYGRSVPGQQHVYSLPDSGGAGYGQDMG